MAVTVTQIPLKSLYGEQFQKVQIDWTADASGNASGAVSLYGFLLKVNTVPSGAPTNLYDITLIDPDGTGLDAVGGLLADRSGTNTEVKYTTPANNAIPVFLCGTYTFTVANAGNATSGKAYLYLVDSL
jgi:hypothetical protein